MEALGGSKGNGKVIEVLHRVGSICQSALIQQAAAKAAQDVGQAFASVRVLVVNLHTAWVQTGTAG